MGCVSVHVYVECVEGKGWCTCMSVCMCVLRGRVSVHVYVECVEGRGWCMSACMLRCMTIYIDVHIYV